MADITDGTDPDRVAAQLMEVVYLPSPETKSRLADHGFERVFVPRAGRWVSADAVCACRDGVAYVAFRGTKQLRDWLVDFMFWPWYWPLRHFGFGRSWRVLEPEVREWLRSQSASPVVLTGHSLGGAIANIAALELTDEFNIQSVTTFGAPRSFFSKGAREYNARLASVSKRYVNGLDVIPRAVPGLLGYRHVGLEVSATDPGRKSHVSRLSDAIDGLSGTGTGYESDTKQLIRTVLGYVNVMLGGLLFLLMLAMLVLTTFLGIFESGASHARRRYLDHLGIPPLKSSTPNYRRARWSHRIRTVVVSLALVLFGLFTFTIASPVFGTRLTLIALALMAGATLLMPVAIWFNNEPMPGEALKTRLGMKPRLVPFAVTASQTQIAGIRADDYARLGTPKQPLSVDLVVRAPLDGAIESLVVPSGLLVASPHAATAIPGARLLTASHFSLSHLLFPTSIPRLDPSTLMALREPLMSDHADIPETNDPERVQHHQTGSEQTSSP